MKQLLRALARNLNPAEDGVHFHTGPAGQAFACHDEHCVAPRRDLRDR